MRAPEQTLASTDLFVSITRSRSAIAFASDVRTLGDSIGFMIPLVRS